MPAWGPALIFPLLGSVVPAGTIEALAAELDRDSPAPQLVFRTLGLYAAKSRLPFEQTPLLLAAVRRNLKAIDQAARNLEAFADTRELEEWGPVGLGAWAAYLNLLFRDYWDLGAPGAEPWNARGLAIVGDLLQRARLPGGAGFRFELRQETLSLWPNALMLYALMKAYENEESVQYETAAIDAVGAIEALRDRDGGYFSTPERGDKNPRANAYLAGGLLLLAKNTGDSSYRERAADIMRWLTTAGAAAGARDAGLEAHVGYLILLLDSLAAPRVENLLGWRPMRGPAAAAALPLAELRPAELRHRPMFDGVLDTLVHRLPRQRGDFAYDYADSPGYAAEILLAAQQTEAAKEILERQQQLLSWPRPHDFDEISFGAGAFFAALDYPEAWPRERARAALARSTMLAGVAATVDRYYMDWLDWLTGGGGYGYGPTVLGAQLALTQLRFAQTYPDWRLLLLVHPLGIGRRLIDNAGTLAWDGTRQVYRARPDSDEVWLLPNAMMMLANLQAHRLTGDPVYLERAQAVAGGIEPLWEPKRGAYFASSTQTGPDGYLSLSTNSYAALALHRLGVATAAASHRDRAQTILDFFQRDLYRDGVVYHHVYRGRRSAGDIWCPGCNWRVLSVAREIAAAPQ